MELEAGKTEIQKLHERPTAVGGFPRHDHEIRRLNSAMRQIEERGRADSSDHLQSGP